MAGKTSIENGKKGGRPLGRKNDKTLMLEAEHAAFQQLVLANIRPLFAAQLSLEKGIAQVYRVTMGHTAAAASLSSSPRRRGY